MNNNPKSKPPRLLQLDGYRFIVALWLVFAHNFDPNMSHNNLFERFCMRRYFGVQFFLILSGFVSQYAYGNRDFSSSETLRKFYIGRFGSILLCYYASMIFSCIIRGIAGHYSTSKMITGGFLSIFLLQTWIPSMAYFGNTPAWTLATMAAHWIAYPFCQRFIQSKSDHFIIGTLFVLPVIAITPIFIGIAISEFTLSLEGWYALYTHPLFRLTDFVYGTILAEIYVRGYRPKRLALFSETVVPILIILTWCVPFSSRTSFYDSFMIEAPMHLFGLLIFGSSCDLDQTFFSKFMAWKPCRDLGDFAFQVYLWRWYVRGTSLVWFCPAKHNSHSSHTFLPRRPLRPIFACFRWWEQGELQSGSIALSWPIFFLASSLLYLISYAWYQFVDNPCRVYLQRITRPQSPDIAQELMSNAQKVNQHQVV